MNIDQPPITDADRIKALETMLSNVQSIEIMFTHEAGSDNPAGFTLLVNGCHRTEFTLPTLREALDVEVRNVWELQARNVCEKCGQSRLRTQGLPPPTTNANIQP